jgi:hypothetical protein
MNPVNSWETVVFVSVSNRARQPLELERPHKYRPSKVPLLKLDAQALLWLVVEETDVASEK